MRQSTLRLEKYNEIRPFFDSLLESGDLAMEFMSAFWNECLERRHNFPTFNELVTFRRGMAANIGYGRTINENSEYIQFLLDFGRARSIAPLEYIKHNQETDVGLPYQFFKDGVLSSPAGLHNTVTAYCIEKALKDFNVPTEHRILEIGAGYGGVAEILVRNLNPEIYVICDLPHNLFLAAYYLSINYPDFNLYFINKSAPERIAEHSLVFTTPKGIELLKEQFTLVVNTYSFQEMTLSEVNRYFSYIHNNMADNGLFYFLNHHGAAGAQKPSDYPFNMFSVQAWRPLPCPEPRFLHRKQHYEVICKTKQSDSQVPLLYFDDITYTLSLLMFMGVDANIFTFCGRLVHSDVQDAAQKYLASLHKIITSKSVDFALKQISLLSPPNDWLSITFYISGLMKLFNNDLKGAENDFKQALLTGLAGFAKTRVLVCLGLLSYYYKNLEWESFIKQAIENSPQFQVELEGSLGNITIEKIKRSYKFAFPNFNIEKEPLMPPILNKLAKRIRNVFFRGKVSTFL